MLSRRDLLRVLGAGAAASALGACGGGRGAGPALATQAATPVDDLRGRLREVVAVLSARFADASALVHRRVITEAAVDTAARGTRRALRSTLVLTARDRVGRVFEQASTDVSAAGLARATAALLARAPGEPGAGAAVDFGAPSEHYPRLSTDPALVEPAQWLEPVAALHARAERAGSSRIVYRGAWIAVDDDEVLFVGRGRDLVQRVVQTRAGIALVAWSGTQPVVGEATISGALGLDALAIPDDAVAAAAARALELLTPTAAPRGDFEIVLDPSVAAAVARVGVAAALAGDRWARGGTRAAGLLGKPVASAGVTIIDDATARPGLGSYWFDDEGWPGQRTVLVDAGVLRAPLTDAASAAALGLARTGNGRRSDGVGVMAPRPSNVAIAPGTATRDDLLAAVERGYLVEGAVTAHVDPATWRLVLHAARCRQLSKGRRTGHVFGDVELRAEVPALLGDVAAVSTAGPAAIHGGSRDGDDGVATSATAPWLLTRGELAPRRGAT